MAAPRKMLDWPRIEIEYKAGARSVLDIAKEFSTSHTTINRRAAERGWQRASGAAVRERADQIMVERTAERVKTAVKKGRGGAKPKAALAPSVQDQAADVAQAEQTRLGGISPVVSDEMVERIEARDTALAQADGGLFHDQDAAEEAAALDDAITDDLIEINARVQVVVQERHRRDIGDARGLVSDLVGELRAETVGRKEFERAIKTMVEQGFPDVALAINKAVSLPTRASTADKLVAAMQKLVAMERDAYSINNDEGGNGIEDLLKKVAAHG